jgi:hypothetical protein
LVATLHRFVWTDNYRSGADEVTWLIVGLLLIAAFGPILWLLPTRTDRRLARMRARARTLGLQVQMVPIPKRNAAPNEVVTSGGKRKSATLLCAAYRRALPRTSSYLPLWKVDRDARGGDGPLPGWVWDVRPAGAEAAALAVVWPLLAALPEDVLAVEATRHDVACYWSERATDPDAEKAVDSLAFSLQPIVDLLAELNDRIEARIKRENASD